LFSFVASCISESILFIQSADSEAMEKLAAELKALRDQLKEREDEAEVAKAGMRPASFIVFRCVHLRLM
jgi:hypothetical protein